MATLYQASLFEALDQSCPPPPFDTEAAARAARPHVIRRISAAAIDQGYGVEAEAAPEPVPQRPTVTDWLAVARTKLSTQPESHQ